MITVLFGKERIPIEAEIVSSKIIKLKPVNPEVFLVNGLI
jgi:hypothetical protein